MSAVASKGRRPSRRGRSILRGKAGQRERVQVGVQFATGRRGVPQSSSFKRWTNAAIAAAGLPKTPRRQWGLSVRVVGSAESRKLNRLWRGKDKPTNVLSFPSELLTPGTQLPIDEIEEAWSLGD